MSDPETAKQKEIKPPPEATADDNNVVQLKPEDVKEMRSLFANPMARARNMKSLPVRPRVGKLNRETFYRAHPDTDYCGEVWLIEPSSDDDAEGEWHLVMPELADDLEGDAKLYELWTVTNREDGLLLCPVRLPMEGEKDNSWWSSLREGLHITREHWARIKSKRGAKRYEVTIAVDEHEMGQPEWSKIRPYEELILLAFGPNGVIRDLDHPKVRQLMGRKQRGE
jgi:hypothetical protein